MRSARDKCTIMWVLSRTHTKCHFVDFFSWRFRRLCTNVDYTNVDGNSQSCVRMQTDRMCVFVTQSQYRFVFNLPMPAQQRATQEMRWKNFYFILYLILFFFISISCERCSYASRTKLYTNKTSSMKMCVRRPSIWRCVCECCPYVVFDGVAQCHNHISVNICQWIHILHTHRSNFTQFTFFQWSVGRSATLLITIRIGRQWQS